jgi:ATP-dependent RNA helicase RhlE
VDILVATPGRLLDLMNQGFIHLNDLEIFVLDEADRMLDMGFIHDVKKVIAASCRASAKRSSSAPPCRRRSRSWPTASSPTPLRWKSRQ